MRNEIVTALAAASIVLVAAGQAAAEPDVWDSRLDDLGIFWVDAGVSPGAWYWRLVSAVYEDESESNGNHNIYYKALDSSGQPTEGQLCWAAWPTGAPEEYAEVYTKGELDGYWGDFPMYGGWCPYYPEGPRGPYGAYVDGPSDEVWGMGLPCNIHVNYRLVWQWTQKAEDAEPAVIEVRPDMLTPATTQGDTPPDDTLTVTNTGERVLQLQIDANADWLTVSPPAADIPPGADQAVSVTVSYSTEQLDPGDYTAAITLSDRDAANSPQVVPVYLTVTPAGGCSGGSGQPGTRAPAGVFLVFALAPILFRARKP